MPIRIFNGVTEYLNYVPGKADNRLNSLWFGTNADMNVNALKLAVQMAS